MFRLLITYILVTSFASISIAQSPSKVNQDRLEGTILKLATYQDEMGRVAFSDADIEGRKYVMQLMQEAGLEVSIDFAGNIIGKRKGTDPNKKPIAFGSHIDMVPQGGNYDGCVGSLSAIEVVRTLKENNISTSHPLEVMIFTDEEGGLVGSRALSGTLSSEALKVVNSTGYTVAEGIDRIGGDASKVSEVARGKGSLAAFLELHIEQGGILEQKKLDIGVVEGIVGIKWWDVTITGFANHAGTTPMNMRQDAMLAAAKFIQAVNEVTNSYEGKQVGTVGRIAAQPGAPNVIPGKVVLSLEIRDLSEEKIDMLFADMKKRSEEIAKASNTSFQFARIDATAKPALTTAAIQKEIVNAAKALGLSYQQMQSGAGHDAQDMALIAPVGMIFVPSKGGISHSPEEFTSAADMANGANVLLQTILALDKKLN